MNVPIDTISFVLGAFIVLMFCLRYFNEPKYPLAFPDKEGDRLFDVALEPALPKLMTYRYRYNLFLWLFIATVEALFIVIAFYLPKFLGNPGKAMEQMGYNAIISALIITGFLPNLSFVKALLEKTRLFFHERAKIPAKGQEVYRTLRSPHISYSVENVSALIEHLEWNHIATDPSKPQLRILNELDFTSDAGTPTRAKWARLTYLLFMVDVWSNNAPCSSCIGSNELGWDSIKAMHNLVKQKILDENEKPEELNTYIDILLSRTYRLIACLLFMADRSCTKLNGYLEEMGYRPNDPPIFGIPFRQLAFAAISTGLGICVGAVLAILISITLKSYKLFPSIDITTTQIIYWTVYGVPFQIAPDLFRIADQALFVTI